MNENPSDKVRHEPKQIELTQDTRSTASDLGDFYVQFTTDMTKYIDSKNSDGDKNVIVSPLSAAMVLGMVTNGVDENIKKVITEYLGTEDTEALNSLCKILLDELPATDNLTNIRLTNSFWTNKDMNVTLEDRFASTIKSMYQSETANLNFSSDPAKSKNTINAWCSRNTDGLIPDFIQDIDPNIIAIALNAMYFNAPWDGPLFSADNTKPATFHGASKDSEVMMMNMIEKPNRYAADESFEYFSLPLGNSSFNLRVMLPKEGLSLGQASELVTAGRLSQLMKDSEQVKLTLDFPKFKAEGKYCLSNMFDMTQLSPLSSVIKFNMFNPEKDGTIIFQQATSFRVDESGAEAAAVTSAEMIDTAAPVIAPQESVTVKVDRPFFFFIDEFSTGACVLSGRIANL